MSDGSLMMLDPRRMTSRIPSMKTMLMFVVRSVKD